MTSKSPYHKFIYKGYNIRFKNNFKVNGTNSYMSSTEVYMNDVLVFSLGTKNKYTKKEFITMIKKEIDEYDKQE